MNPASHSLSPRTSHVPLQQQLQQQQADTLGQQLLQQQQQVVGAASNNNSGGEGAQSGRVGSKEGSYITIEKTMDCISITLCVTVTGVTVSEEACNSKGLPAYSDSVGTPKSVTVTGIFSMRRSFHGPKNCHCSRCHSNRGGLEF